MIPPWQMQEANQAAIIVAAIAAFASIIVVIVQSVLHRRDKIADEKRHRAERVEDDRRHMQEMKRIRDDAQSHEIDALEKLDKQREREIKELQNRANTLDLVRDGTQALLFEKLHKIHSEMIARGGVCPDDEKQVAERVYQSYHALGGNGVGTAMYKDILAAHSKPKVREDK